MVKNKALSMLSIAAKAGKVVSGGFMTERALQDNSACLVIIADDASDNTKKKFINKCKYYNVSYFVFESSDVLGKSIGKQERTTLAITDEGLAKQIIAGINSSKDMEV